MSEFRFNVAQLLQEPTGAIRRYKLDDTQLVLDDTLRMAPVQGDVRLTRTPNGVLADATVHGDVAIDCSRCLMEYQQTLAFEFSEEYFQTVNVNTGARLPSPDEDEVFLIDETHKLDLADALREYALLNLPPAPRCREDCQGLCSQCGHNLNDGTCDCEADTSDDRFAALSKLLGDDRSL